MVDAHACTLSQRDAAWSSSPSMLTAGDNSGDRLVVISGPVQGEVIELSQPEAIIGRDAPSTILLPDQSVSRRHCALARTGNAWELRDLGSANGTFVNSVQVTSHQLAHGDRIVVGESTLVFVTRGVVRAQPAHFVDTAPVVVSAHLGVNDAVAAPALVQESGSRVVQRLRALLTMSAAINGVRTEPELHDQLLSLIHELVLATDAAVVLVDATGAMSVAASITAAPNQPVLVSRTVVRRVMHDRVGVLTYDEAVAALKTASPSLDGVRSVLCAPLTSSTTAFGALYLARANRLDAFDEDDLKLVTALGHLAGIAIANVRRVSDLEHEAERLRAGLALDQNLVGSSEPMRLVYERLTRVARSDTTALIVGETGTGKELAARAIHVNGTRARRPFVAINCAALADSLLESELFGHERGAFTGAVGQKKGKVELAEGGTLFLDEIAELPLLLQSKLLRVLQEREFERVGGTRPIKADIRVISATNRNLPEEVSQKRFRQDLFFRLNVVAIQMPPLRERPTDIPLLARHFLERHARKAPRLVTSFSPAALACLTSHDWPGNVRELENVVQRAIVLGSTPEILPEDLPDDLVHGRRMAASAMSSSELDFHTAVVATKKRLILEAFRLSAGSYVETARLLGLDPNYLHRLIRNLNLKSQLDSTRSESA
jgi:transcriptional regulator with GAF, ATPase, and Fis domain/pSer/pThr/pTyr-binding forkhead associated (FHA) protein